MIALERRDMTCERCGADSWQAVGYFEPDDYLQSIELFCSKCGEYREIPL